MLGEKAFIIKKINNCHSMVLLLKRKENTIVPEIVQYSSIQAKCSGNVEMNCSVQNSVLGLSPISTVTW